MTDNNGFTEVKAKKWRRSERTSEPTPTFNYPTFNPPPNPPPTSSTTHEPRCAVHSTPTRTVPTETDAATPTLSRICVFLTVSSVPNAETSSGMLEPRLTPPPTTTTAASSTKQRPRTTTYSV